LVKKC